MSKIKNLKIFSYQNKAKIVTGVVFVGIIGGIVALESNAHKYAGDIIIADDATNHYLDTDENISQLISKANMLNTKVKKYDYIDEKMCRVGSMNLLRVGRYNEDALEYGYVEPESMVEIIPIGYFDAIIKPPRGTEGRYTSLLGVKYEDGYTYESYLDKDTLAFEGSTTIKYEDNAEEGYKRLLER